MNVVAKEMAEVEFNRMGELNFLDFDVSEMKPEEVEQFNNLKRVIVNAIIKGWLIITDEGTPVYTPVNSTDSSPLTFHKPQGKEFMEADRKKTNELVARTYAAMGAWTKQPATRFVNMAENPDLKVCKALFQLFF